MGWQVLKKRIIPVQLLMNERLVKTIRFGKYRDVGNPVTSSKVYNDSDGDELVFLNIDRSHRTIKPLLTIIEKVSEVCFMPLALGGGIRSIDDAGTLIKNGADKVVINSACYTHLHLISQIADKFGSQAVVVSIDAKYDNDAGEYRLYADCGRQRQEIALKDHVNRCVKQGAGEIFVNSIDHDGTMEGYDIRLIKSVVHYAGIPVIGCGGAGNFEHMKDAFLQTGTSALACASLFNFGDNNPIRAKAFLSNYSISFKAI
jgi:cyclase